MTTDDRAKFEALSAALRELHGKTANTYGSETLWDAANALARAALASAQAASAEPAAPIEGSELEDMARIACEEALAFGIGLDSFHRLAKSVMKRYTTPAPAVAPAAVTEIALADVIDALNVFNKPGRDEPWDESSAIVVSALPAFIRNVVAAWYGPDARAWAHLTEPAMLAAENCRLYAARHRKEPWAAEILRMLEAHGFKGSPLRTLATRTPEPQAEPQKPLFASSVARRKWEVLQAQGHRMQRLYFEREDGRSGHINPWGVVTWSDAASPTPDEQRAQAAQEGVDWKLTDKQCDDAIREAGFAFVGPRDAAMLRGLCRAAIRAALAGRQQL